MRSLIVGRRTALDFFGAAALMIALYAGEAQAQTVPAFGSPALYPVGIGPTTIRSADFNGDGNLDLVVVNSANGGDGSISILLGKGDGRFHERMDRPGGSQPYGLAVGEITGDRRLDLITTIINSHTVSILRGLPGGRFASAASLPAADYPSQVVIEDFDRNRLPDFAVTMFRSNIVSVFLAKGHGKFDDPVDYRTQDGPASIASADLNGDGIPDLVVGNLYTDYSVYASPATVFLGRGDGTFGTGTTTYVGRGPEEMVTGDFDENGRVDLAAVNFDSRTLAVLLGDGTGAFVKEEYPTGDLPLGLAAADFNADHHLDLAVTNHQDNTVSVFAGRGDGTFVPRVDYPAGGEFFINPTRIVAGDFNRDGLPDLALTNSVSNSISVLLNSTVGRSPSQALAEETGGVASPPRTDAIVTVLPNPNRSGSAVKISYSVSAQKAHVRVCIYSVQGVLVRTLELGYQQAGTHSAYWDGRGKSLERVSAGIYFVRVNVGSRSSTTRLLMIP